MMRVCSKICGLPMPEACGCVNYAAYPEESVKISRHIQENMVFQRYELEYSTLAPQAGRYLCVAGKCRRCGKRICFGISIPENLEGGSFLSLVYRWLRQLSELSGRGFTPVETGFQEMFLSMFGDMDKAYVLEWLLSHENQMKGM